MFKELFTFIAVSFSHSIIFLSTTAVLVTLVMNRRIDEINLGYDNLIKFKIGITRFRLGLTVFFLGTNLRVEQTEDGALEGSDLRLLRWVSFGGKIIQFWVAFAFINLNPGYLRIFSRYLLLQLNFRQMEYYIGEFTFFKMAVWFLFLGLIYELISDMILAPLVEKYPRIEYLRGLVVFTFAFYYIRFIVGIFTHDHGEYPLPITN